MKPRQQRYRIKLTGIIVAVDESSGDRFIFSTENISTTGAMILLSNGEHSRSLVTGQTLQAQIQLPALDQGLHELTCLCTIVRHDPGRGYGVSFTFRQPGDQKLLQSYMAKFAAEFPEAIC